MHAPQHDGYYWLAIDDATGWVGRRPYLVKVRAEESMVGWDEDAHKEVIVRMSFFGDEFGEMIVERFADLATGTIHKFWWSTSIGGFIPSSSGAEYRITWLAEVKAPRLPLELAA